MQVSINPDWVGLGFLLPVGEGVLLEVFVGVGVAVGLVVGRGRPLRISTQYELPTLMPLQSSLTLGFFASSQLQVHQLLSSRRSKTYVFQELRMCQTPSIFEVLTVHRAIVHSVPVGTV